MFSCTFLFPISCFCLSGECQQWTIAFLRTGLLKGSRPGTRPLRRTTTPSVSHTRSTTRRRPPHLPPPTRSVRATPCLTATRPGSRGRAPRACPCPVRPKWNAASDPRPPTRRRRPSTGCRCSDRTCRPHPRFHSAPRPVTSRWCAAVTALPARTAMEHMGKPALTPRTPGRRTQG